MELKNYQIKAINELFEETVKFLNKNDNRKIVFKAPTGSGKTVMIAKYLERFTKEIQGNFSFVWLSIHELHNQSKNRLQSIINNGVFKFSNLEDVQDNILKQNEILFINWEKIRNKAKQDNPEKGIQSGDYTNIFMADNEYNRNLKNFITNAKDEGRTIILIIDESHLHMTIDSKKIIDEIIQPKLQIDISATPEENPNVDVELQDVIDEQMIKKEVIINPELKNDRNLIIDEAIIEEAIKKQKYLKDLYLKNNSNINPLILIQLPNEKSTLSDLDKQKIDEIKDILKNKFNITEENKRLSLWLSEDKVNLEEIDRNSSIIDALIFKQAIATGWDCPRAQILIKFRETGSQIFEIQTVGRIMRMPELKHYQNEDLNKAYLYTNIENISIAEGVAQEYIKRKEAKRKNLYSNINLKSYYLPRIDYNDLKLEFRPFLHKEFFNKINGFYDIEKSKENINIANKFIDFNKELNTKIITNLGFSNIDEIDNKIFLSGDKKEEFKQSYSYVKVLFYSFLSSLCAPFQQSRSTGILEQSIYELFEKYLGFEEQNKSRLDIQSIVLTNQSFFIDLINKSKDEYIKSREIKIKEPIETIFNVPEYLSYPDTFNENNFDKCILSPCFLDNKWKTENDFINNYLEQSSEIEWWFKNGQGNKIFFGITYKMNNELKGFYPDFIVKYKDERIGIFDTKEGITAEQLETKLKAEALQEYIKEAGNNKLFGGIVIPKENGRLFKLNTNDVYEVSNGNLISLN